MAWHVLAIIILRWNQFKPILITNFAKMNFIKFKFFLCVYFLLNTGSTVFAADLSPSQMIAASIELLEIKLGDNSLDLF